MQHQVPQNKTKFQKQMKIFKKKKTGAIRRNTECLQTHSALRLRLRRSDKDLKKQMTAPSACRRTVRLRLRKFKQNSGAK
jgi:hypothetical protein